MPGTQTIKELKQRIHELEAAERKYNQTQAALTESEKLYRLLAENVSDVVWLLDIETNILKYISPSVVNLVGYTAKETMEQGLEKTLTASSVSYFKSVLPGRIERFKKGQKEVFWDEFEQYHKNGRTIWTQVVARYVRNSETGRIEAIGVSRDISSQKRIEEETDGLVRKLQQALDEIKTLRGIIPICAHCKQIRDDKGSWNQIEKYIADHSDAEFSHGICYDCSKKFYSTIRFYED